jgi:hypothetical protein
MKFFLILVGTLAAGFVGYFAEPSLRYQLTGVPAGSAEDPVIIQIDGQGNTTRIRVDLASLTPEQLPERVTLREDILVSDAESGVTMRVETGSQVRPLRMEKRDLVVSPGVGNFEGIVAVASTDLLQQLTSPRPPAGDPRQALATNTHPMDRPVRSPGAGAGTGGMMGSADEEPDEMTSPAGDLAVNETDEPTLEDPAPDPVTADEEDEAMASTDPAEPEDNTPVEDVVATMQASIKAGQIQEFTFDQVTEWTAEENETIDGQEFQIGTATYQKETFLGVQNIQAKALIRGGKVQRWVGARSGLEIK